MQRTPQRCPHCREPLWLHNDMWGPYYLCDDCGWTAEDDDQLALAAPVPLTALSADTRPRAGQDRARP